MKEIAIGLMSGTSADGLSIAACSFAPSLKTIVYHTYDYPRPLGKKILSAAHLKVSEISRLNFELGHFYAARVLQFLKEFRLQKSAVTVIGSHGQTIYHGPKDHPANTFQIGEASFMAERTGIPVVCDFRVRDIAAGGSGAPLIPFFDQYFFGKGKPAALQNIGGIANVTYVGKNVRPIAFDNGPGNCFMDWAARKYSGEKKAYDRNGETAARGKIYFEIIQKMMRHPYFKARPPKSTGRELFSEAFLPHRLKKLNLNDLMATLTYFTAFSIHNSYQKFLNLKSISKVIVSGGGAFNSTLMSHLRELFMPIPVLSIQDFGIHPQAKEPAAFAFFAWQVIHGKTNHLPETTGAKHACLLGKIIPGKL